MVKITDFGLAFLSTAVSDRTRLTSELSALGSPHYMAPEQMNAGGVVDLRADLYSLGATAFHLLAGRPPFDGLTLTQIIARKLGDEQPSLHDARPGLTDASVDLVGRLLVRDPQRRIGSYAELLDRIDALPGMNGGVTNATVALTANQTSLTPTIAVAATPATAGHQPWRDLLLTVGTILVLIAGGFTIRHFLVKPTTASSTSASTLKETGWSASLHNGTSLEGWKTDSGSWTTDVDDEGGAVITGTSGEIIRTIAKTIDGRAARVVNYRLTITVRLHAASAIELHFNIAKTGARDVVRLTLDRVSLGHRAGSRAKFEPIDAAQPCEVGVDRLHELRLERDIAVWRVFLDDTEVGVIEASKPAERNEFRLVVEGGPAWFGDVAVEELAPAASGR